MGKSVVCKTILALLGLNREENRPLPYAPMTRNKFFFMSKYLKNDSDTSPLST